MPKILFVTATAMEAKCVTDAFGSTYPTLISGMGGIPTMVATLAAIESSEVVTIVQVGIAGAIDSNLTIGEVVIVSSDTTADLGAWRSESEAFVPFEATIYNSDFQHDGFRRVSARTVSTATSPIIKTSHQIETMEGAHFMAMAEYKKVKAIQIRAISNYITDSRENWQIPLALNSLTEALKNIF